MTSTNYPAYKPKCTIVIPTRRGGCFLSRALKSVERQLGISKEVIVVNDSPDGQDLPRFQESSDEVYIVRNLGHHGPGAARNLGINLATGEYISLLDDDDEFVSSDFLYQSCCVLNSASKNFVVAIGNFEKVEYFNSAQPTCIAVSDNQTASSCRFDLIDYFLSIGSGCGLTFRTQFLKECKFDTTFLVAEDTEFFFRIISLGYYPIFLPTVGVRIHAHNGNRLSDSTHHLQRLYECQRVLKVYEKILTSFPKTKERFENCIIKLKNELSLPDKSI